jgi:hypothetical protein
MLLKLLRGLIGGTLGAVFGFIAGGISGIQIGATFFKDFVFNGQRGYEAVGPIGAILGAILGAIAGILLALKIKKQRGNGISI